MSTYILLCIGNGFASQKIQKYSESELVPLCDRASHVAVRHGDFVIESHFKSSGVVKKEYETWKKEQSENRSRVLSFEYPLNWKILETYAYLHVPYGTGDIWNQLFDGMDWGFFAEKTRKDARSVTCSELLAECELLDGSDRIFNSTKLFEDENWKVKPVHYQELAIKQGLPIEEIL